MDGMWYQPGGALPISPNTSVLDVSNIKNSESLIFELEKALMSYR